MRQKGGKIEVKRGQGNFFRQNLKQCLDTTINRSLEKGVQVKGVSHKSVLFVHILCNSAQSSVHVSDRIRRAHTNIKTQKRMKPFFTGACNTPVDYTRITTGSQLFSGGLKRGPTEMGGIQGFSNLWLRQGGLVTGARVPPLGLPHAGAEGCSH